MSIEQHPDDLGPPDDLPPAPIRRPKGPRGFGWAIALAVVVLAIASFVALRSDPDTGNGDVVDLSAALDAGESNAGANPLTGRSATGTPLPDNSLERFEGGQGSLTDHRGTPVVVNFFASTCVPCRTEMPAFEAVHQRVGDRVQFVGVNTGEAIDRGRRIAADTGVTYPLLSDPSGATMTALGSVVLPTTVLAGADGIVIAVHNGVLTDSQLEKWIDDNLEKKGPA